MPGRILLALGGGRAGRAADLPGRTRGSAARAGHGVEARQPPDRALLDALGVAVYVTDVAGRITYFNEAAAALWGCRPVLGDARFCGSWRLFWPDGAPMRHDECPMAVAVREQRAVDGGEAVAERPDGTRVPFAAYPTPLRDAAGAVVGALNVLVDISGRKATRGGARRQRGAAARGIRGHAGMHQGRGAGRNLAADEPGGVGMVEAEAPGDIEGRSVFGLIAPEDLAAWQANMPASGVARRSAGSSASWDCAVAAGEWKPTPRRCDSPTAKSRNSPSPAT